MSVICVSAVLSQIVLIKKLLLHRLDISVKQKVEHGHLCDIFKHDRIVYSVDCVLAPGKRSVRVYIYCRYGIGIDVTLLNVSMIIVPVSFSYSPPIASGVILSVQGIAP